jgi:hypothetical protein
MGLFGSKPQPAPTPLADAVASIEETPPKPSGLVSSGTGKYVLAVLGGALLLYLLLAIYNWIRKRQGLLPVSLFGDGEGSGDKTPTIVDGKSTTTISAAELPTNGAGDNSIQFWMFIKDWDYKFGQAKDVLKRVSSTNVNYVSPRVRLSPSDNTLDVAVSLFPTGRQAPGAVSGLSAAGDLQTCSVENVPLQTWFSVSITVFQRNMDIYINGRLVKSCVLQGVPRVALGDIILADNGGFSGSICNVNAYSKMIGPEEASAFYAKGTTCQAPAGPKDIDKDSLFITLFGYTFRFSTFNKKGEELSSYTF